MPDVAFYAPTDRGLEARIRARLDELRKLDRTAARGDEPPQD